MKRTKIVCTLGPASEKEEILRELMLNGLNVARQNFSHGDHEEHKRRMDLVKKLRSELNLPIAIMLDTKGPEIRTKDFENGLVELKEGQEFTITTRQDVIGNESICAVTYEGLAEDVKIGDTILIDDGLIALDVIEIKDKDIKCIVKNSGIVKNKKGVNVPGVKIQLPAITEKDRSDIEFGISQGIDLIAASFIRKAADVLAIREILEENGATDIQIISKIENQEGVDNIDEIIEVSDGIMVARGDLGVEIPAQDVPLVQKMIIRKCNEAGKPVITATQMLDSMQKNPRPTRAEVGDVANAILDGTDAVMLSGETAAGKYPIESVKIMAEIAKKTETSRDFIEFQKSRANNISKVSVTNAISHATVTTAKDLNATAIITATSSGHTAKAVSKFRPEAPIIAATTKEDVMRKMAVLWGVHPILVNEANSTDEIIEVSVDKALEEKLINYGDLVVITAGVPVGVSGSTNLIKVHTVGEAVIKGTGIGKTGATGKVCIVKSREDALNKFEDGDILVAINTDKDLVEFMERAAAIVTEKGGLTSHAAVVGISIGKPVIVGASEATKILKDGETITIDSLRGLIYKGKATVL